MAHVSIKELTDVIQKSGLPLGNSTDMANAAPFARDVVASNVPMADFGGEALKSSYGQTLAKIAEMDSKLGQVYGDPTSNLYIERASTRQSAINSGPASTGYKAAGNIADVYRSRKASAEKQQEQTVNDALSFYSKLTSLQAKEEARIKKETKKKGKGTGTAGGNDIKLIKKGRYDLAGLTDPKAIETWDLIGTLDGGSKFQEQWVKEYQHAKASGEASTDAKENYYTSDDIRGAWDAFNKKRNSLKPKTAAQLKKEEKGKKRF